MIRGPEHQLTWRSSRELADGDRLEVIARHIRKRRLPRGHELARQHMSGRPMQMVEEVHYSWAVLLNGRRAGELRQAPSGMFTAGSHSFPRLKIEEAAEELVYRLGIRRRPEPPSSSPTP